MSDIVADARRWLDVRNGRVSTHSENCHQWHAECLVARLTAEVQRHRMTEAERKAVAVAAEQEAMLAMVNDDDVSQWHTDRALMLRALLARTAPPAAS